MEWKPFRNKSHSK